MNVRKNAGRKLRRWEEDGRDRFDEFQDRQRLNGCMVRSG